jgi:hypothetical protein
VSFIIAVALILVIFGLIFGPLRAYAMEILEQFGFLGQGSLTLQEAIECSYLRCKEGCGYVNSLEWKYFPCRDYCDTKNAVTKKFMDADNKVCDWNALQYPVVFDPNTYGTTNLKVTKDMVRDEADCIVSEDTDWQTGVVPSIEQISLNSLKLLYVFKDVIKARTNEVCEANLGMYSAGEKAIKEFSAKKVPIYIETGSISAAPVCFGIPPGISCPVVCYGDFCEYIYNCQGVMCRVLSSTYITMMNITPSFITIKPNVEQTIELRNDLKYRVKVEGVGEEIAIYPSYDLAYMSGGSTIITCGDGTELRDIFSTSDSLCPSQNTIRVCNNKYELKCISLSGPHKFNITYAPLTPLQQHPPQQVVQ